MLHTVNAGSPDPQSENRGIPWVALIFGFFALVFVALVGPGLVGALLAIMAPPEPPVPPDSRLLRYTRETYGVDTWTYDTDQDVCALIGFFQQRGGNCSIVPPRCAANPANGREIEQSDDLIASCSGDMEFSIFAMRWEFEIPVRSAPGPQTQFDLSRRVFWTGPPPVSDS